MSQEDTAPIVVNSSAIPEQVMSTLRLVLGYGVAYFTGKGIIDEATGTQIVGFLIMVVPAAWSLYVTTRKHSKMKALANEAPNYVAQVK